MVDKDLLVGALESSKKDMYKFLRDIVAIPSESSQEEKVIQRIAEEMNKVGFDRVWTDPMGNLIGEIGSGERIIAFDAHIDTVGIGDLSAWDFDPYEGYEDEEYIGGRGTTDQKGGIAAMVYAGGMMKRLGLVTDYKILFVASVQEEDCDGLCWDYIISQDGIRPEFVVSTEPTNCQIYRGHRGRMEIKVQTKGISCHGSAPERGINAIYKMADIISEIEKLNDRLLDHPFLGKGTLTISEIYSNSPSRCAVADECIISIDRRLTFGETAELALEQIRSLPAVQAAQAVVEMYDYAKPSYTGLTYPTDCYFPAWAIEQEHVVTQSLFETFKFLFEKEPVVDKWTFSTNCVSIMGKYQIPCIGFGPGKEEEAHAPNEKTWKSHLDQCALMYTLIPSIYEKALLNSN